MEGFVDCFLLVLPPPPLSAAMLTRDGIKAKATPTLVYSTAVWVGLVKLAAAAPAPT